MYRLDFKAYRRRFAGAFSNAREQFAVREGIIVRMEDRDGRVGFGEAAPLPSFGTESFVSALTVATELAGKFAWNTEVQRKLGQYPALRVAIEGALDMLRREGVTPAVDQPWPVCGLVGDSSDLFAVAELRAMHYRCLKLKIGKDPFVAELRAIDRIVNATDGEVQLRLDANGTLTARQTADWLERCAELPVEFVEQPMPVGEEREMMRLAEDFPTPIALDESVCAVDDLKRWRDAQWQGVYVLKPLLCGSLVELREELSGGGADCVFSSSLETVVGAWHGLAVALEAKTKRRRPLGFGVDRLFADKNVSPVLGPFLQNETMPNTDHCQLLWNQI